MKLNVRRTVLVGFAFLSICAFWQMYNSVIPLILTNTFHMNEMYSGIVMAADNLLALFLLPLFGTLSDRCRSPLGRRMPFVLFGTLAAVILMLGLPVLDNSYAAAPAGWKLTAFICVLGGLLVAMDQVFHTDMQKDTIVQAIYSVALDPTRSNRPMGITGITGTAVNGRDLGIDGYLDIGLLDTMKDLFVNFIGAVVFSVTGYVYVKTRGKKKTAAQSFVPRPKPKNRDFLQKARDEAAQKEKRKP